VRRSVTKQLLNSLANDSSQPSVRYLMEWIIVRNLSCETEDWDIFFEESVKVTNTAINFHLVKFNDSFILILYSCLVF